jgi:hypothetical protein
MSKYRVALCLLVASCGFAVHAQLPEGAIPMREMLTRYIDMLGSQCKIFALNLPGAEAKEDQAEARLLKSMQQMMCVCHPAKAASLLETLPAAQLSKLVANSQDFHAVAVPGIMEPCHGEHMREFFQGDNCLGAISTDLAKETRAVSYCACMRKETAGLTDHQVSSSLSAVRDHMPALNAAKAGGQSFPARPELVDKWVGMLHRCGGGLEFGPPK